MSEQSHPTLNIRKGISTDELWLIIILAGFLFFTSLVPLPPNDFWWHLKIGELIYLDKVVPTTNIFAWTLPSNEPFFYGAWLADLLFFVLHKIGNLELVIFIRTLLAGISFWLVGYEAKRESGSWRIAALVTAIACLMVTNNLPVRTQMWSWLPFITFLIILGKFVDGEINPKWLFLIPLMMVFWVNAHGAFILGLVLIGIFFVGEGISVLLKLDNNISWKNLAWIGVIGLLSTSVVLINPQHINIIDYVIGLMTDQPSQQLVVEWQTPTPKGIANTTFYISILILLISFAYTEYKPSPTRILLITGFLWLAWSGQRYVIWYAMVSMPILARAIKDLPVKSPVFTPQRNWLNLLIIFIVFIPVILVQPWFVESFPLPDRYWDQVIRDSPEGPMISTATPIDAAYFLKQNPGGNLYNEMGQGSYLIWAIPDQGDFIDPRVELFPYQQWQDYIHINYGARYNELLNRYGVNRILIDVELQKDLADVLESDPLWVKEYEDNRTKIFNKALQ
jgi:hypothetical protein